MGFEAPALDRVSIDGDRLTLSRDAIDSADQQTLVRRTERRLTYTPPRRVFPGAKGLDMLALTRRKGEEVVIGDPGSPLGLIRVVDIQGDKVKVAFDFPRDVAINRKELADAKASAPTPAPAALL